MTSPGSWWQHKVTGHRLIIPERPNTYMEAHWVDRKIQHRGFGQPAGRIPGFEEGGPSPLRWVDPATFRDRWRAYRPRADVRCPPPVWVTKPIDGLNDFILDGRLWLSVLGIRGNVIALTGTEDTEKNFPGWGRCNYTTKFIHTWEARTRLRPRYATIRPTAWDILRAGTSGAPRSV
jgi:hypothetical protein